MRQPWATKISSMSLKAVSPRALTQCLHRGLGSSGQGVRSSLALSLSRLVGTIEVANVWRSYQVPSLVLCALRSFSSGQPCAMVIDVTTALQMRRPRRRELERFDRSVRKRLV